MNFCTKCSSYYSKPGTCNCFAAVQRVEPSPWWYPVYPQPFQVPTTGEPFPESGQTWCDGATVTGAPITITNNDGDGTDTWTAIRDAMADAIRSGKASYTT